MKLTEIARKTLEEYFNGKEFILDSDIKEKYKNKRACFVTLTKNGKLRGCIGSLQARQELWKEVQENAVNAAFEDPRFPMLEENELRKIKIEVSILSEPKKLKFDDDKDLLKKLDKNKGIILKRGAYSATFLPQVWKDLPDKKTFLEHLCMKAGLEKNDWKSSEIWLYNVEIESEE